MFKFEQFPVYQKTEDLFNQLLSSLLKNREIDGSTRDQLNRAAKSIIFNIAEGAGKYGKNDKKNFYTIARGSAYECASIIKTLMLEKKMSTDLFKKLYKELDEISLMLSHLIIHLKSRP